MNDAFFVLVASVSPALILLYYIYNKDMNQPEPTKLIIKGFGLGVLSLFASFFVSIPFGVLGLYGDVVTTWRNAFGVAFFGAAIPEETAKLFMLWLLLRRNHYFDEHMDGIVYAVAVSMGFAALENVSYLFFNYDSWRSVGVARALVSVPAHYAFAVFMGYYYSLCCFGEPAKKYYYKAMIFVAPVLLHGVFDMLLFMLPIREELAVIILVSFCVFCYNMHKYAARRIKEHLAAIP